MLPARSINPAPAVRASSCCPATARDKAPKLGASATRMRGRAPNEVTSGNLAIEVPIFGGERRTAFQQCPGGTHQGAPAFGSSHGAASLCRDDPGLSGQAGLRPQTGCTFSAFIKSRKGVGLDFSIDVPKNVDDGL